MDINKKLKDFSEDIIKTSNLKENTKNQLFKFVNESNPYDIMNLLLTGKAKHVSEDDNKKEIFREFKDSDLPNKFKYFIKEQEDSKKIDKQAVIKAATDAAEDIFKKPDHKLIKQMVDDAIKKAKDTEDAIQITINMMRSD